MENGIFTHRVSKGSRFNQIYIPKRMELYFESGDLVEVRLLKKKNLFYSSKIRELSDFKKNLIKNIFQELRKFKDIQQIFIIGSFLTQKTDYNDIDIVLISDKNIEKQAYELLVSKFELKFHIIVIAEKSLEYLEKSCPLTRSMLHSFISNKQYALSKETKIDKNHIKFLLMMPEDILKIKLKSRAFYDSIRRLITIERFLEKKNLNPVEIEKEIKGLLGESFFTNLKSNEEIEINAIKKLRNIIKSKLKEISKKIK